MTTLVETPGVAVPVPRQHNGWQTFILGAMAACLAWLLAQVGLKIAFAGILGIAFVALLMLVRERERVTLFFGVLSMVAILHKSFSGIQTVSSGPPSVYVNSVDVITILLYGLWFATGTLGRDLREQLRRPIIWLPLVAMVFSLPSLLVADSPTLSIAEFVRMGFEWLVFVYVAARVRRRSDVWLILSALGTIVVIEFVVVVGQWLTHSPLGLSFLGTPDVLNQRITDTQSLGRPFGTITHPVFMGAFLGPLVLLALCLAINLRNRRAKIVALGAVALGTAPMAISHTRSAALGLAVAMLLVILASLATRRLPLRVLGAWMFAGLIAVVVMWNQILGLYHDNFHTQHFSLEVSARGQLYNLGWSMFDAHPLVGTGLNNFQAVMEQYNHLGLIFDGNPVHNLFLLQASETGLIGFVGLLMAGLPVLFMALKVARSRDRLYSAIGMAVAAMFAFFIVEEMFVFSLRQDHPRTLFWLLAGLVAACSRLMNQPEAQAEPALAAAPRPGGFSSNGHGPAVRTSPTKRPLPARTSRTPRWRAAWRTAWQRVAKVVQLSLRALGRAGVVLARAGARPVPAVLRTGRVVLRSAGRVADVVLPRSALAGAATLVLAMGIIVVPAAGRATDPSPAQSKIVFTAQDRSPDNPGVLLQQTGIYVANADGSDVHEIVGHNGYQYSWSKWALGGTKIVFTAHLSGTDQPDQLYLMNADGSHAQQLTSTQWVNGQPSVSPDGRYLLFTSTWTEFPKFALYRMDLRTLMVTNLSALASTRGAADADPRYSQDGSHIAFAVSKPRRPGSKKVLPTQIWMMPASGSPRVQLTHDHYYNTDPQLSPSGQDVVYSSYRGPGTAGDGGKLQAKLFDWFIVVHNRRTGAEHVLNEGTGCATRPVDHPCGPAEGASYVPEYSPDGHDVAYISILSRTTSCICIAGADGSDPRVLISTTQKIQYFDWQTIGSAPDTAVDIGSAVPSSRLLFLGSTAPGSTAIYEARPDRWGAATIGVPPFLGRISDPRWAPDRTHILFSAQAPPHRVPPPPDAPRGHHRIRHYTLGWLAALMMPHPDRTTIDRTQTYVMDPDGGNLRVLTTGSTEDWHDAIPDGEWRGNMQPDLSPDGKYVVVTNMSSTTSESFLLRINVKTGAVYNLTNATAGAVATTDFNPRFSPDGKRIVFSTMVGGSAQIAEISAKTGRRYHALTNDTYFNIAPVWSPDGRYVVYSSYRGTGPIETDPTRVNGQLVPGHITQNDWYLVRVDTRTGHHTVLTSPADSPTFSPAYSPDGTQIAYIGLEHGLAQPDIYVMPAAGGPPHPLQITLQTKELSLDWR